MAGWRLKVTDDQPVVFNAKQVLTMACDDVELARQIVEVFLDDIPKQLENLKDALIEKDAKTAERISHSVKGAAATVGGEILREIALVCEQCGRENRLAELQDNVPAMEQAFAELRQALLAAGYNEPAAQ